MASFYMNVLEIRLWNIVIVYVIVVNYILTVIPGG